MFLKALRFACTLGILLLWWMLPGYGQGFNNLENLALRGCLKSLHT
jgi:hypothetical protein